ncbi:hypothetical protein HDU84_000379, partial [Entophlyctis sp. JEL0112]
MKLPHPQNRRWNFSRSNFALTNNSSYITDPAAVKNSIACFSQENILDEKYMARSDSNSSIASPLQSPTLAATSLTRRSGATLE